MTAGTAAARDRLIAANGFFVGAEFAVLAARRGRLEPLLRRRAVLGPRCAHRAASVDLRLPVRDHPGLIGPWHSVNPPARLLVGPFEACIFRTSSFYLISLAIALTLISALHMLLGEMVPKNLPAGPNGPPSSSAPLRLRPSYGVSSRDHQPYRGRHRCAAAAAHRARHRGR